MAKSPACPRVSPIPATPAKTVSKSTCRRRMPYACGNLRWKRAPNSASNPAGSAHAIPCGWRPRWRSTVTRSTPPSWLGARNTLRLEAKMALYGHEIDATISPLEADLGWIVKLDKGEFVGRDALLKQKESGIRRKLIGFEMRGRGIGRDGY